MSISTVQNIQAEILTLSREEKLEVINIVVDSLREDAGEPTKRKRSLLELRGLGKEIWKDVDPVEYVRKERNSWD